ncbi:unnamed protein product [Rotaria sp. Silwood1]|nr:unnamed protein product [Rotaria sp. Silwood1]
MPKRLQLPSAVLNIKPLNASALSFFLSEDTLGTIFNRLMVEEWKMSSNFYNYYSSCAPAICTYRIVQRLDRIYIVAIVGGLTTSLRFIVSFVVNICYSIIIYRRQRRSSTHSRQLQWHEGK